MTPGELIKIDAFEIEFPYKITCLTCKREAAISYWPSPSRQYAVEGPSYGTVIFTPMHHDPHCPARNHVYLEGIGPMVEPRAMVMEKGNDDKP